MSEIKWYLKCPKCGDTGEVGTIVPGENSESDIICMKCDYQSNNIKEWKVSENDDLKTFMGVLTAIKPLKTSGDVQFVITVPQAMADEALRRAGGFINPAESRWCAIAVLNEEKKDDPQS